MDVMSMQKALQLAGTYDNNHNGIFDRSTWSSELYFNSDATRWLDEDLDGKISVKELAKGLQSGDVDVYDGGVSMTHRIGRMPPAVAPAVRMDLQVKTQVNT